MTYNIIQITRKLPLRVLRGGVKDVQQRLPLDFRYPRAFKYPCAWDISGVCEPMFDGSVYPKSLTQMFE
jgi:hypothetical protein